MAFSWQKHVPRMFIPILVLFCIVSGQNDPPFTGLFQMPDKINMPGARQTETEHRLDELTEEIEELKNLIPSGGIQTDEASATTNISADIETMKTSIDQIDAKVNQETQKLRDLINQMTQTLEEKTSADSHSALASDTENLKTIVDEILSDVEQVKTKIDTLEHGLQEIGSQYDEMTVKVAGIEQNLEQLETEYVITKSQVDQVKHSVHQIEASVDEVDRSVNEVTATVETVKTETTGLEQSLHQIQTMANHTSTEVGTLSQTLQQAETQFEEKQHELESAVDKLKNDMVQQEELGQQRCLHGEQQNAITMDAIVAKIINDEGLDRLPFVDADGSPSNANRPVTLAIDGNLEQVVSYCTHSLGDEVNPWWEGDLGTVAEVHQLTLYNRVDCCSDRLVNFKIEGYGTQNRQSPLLCKDVGDASGTITTIPCNNPIHARYIRITKNDIYLTLCEVIAEGINLRRGVQISTANTESGAYLAYDGNTDTCSETENEPDGAWWQIILSEMTTIVSVDVTNRKDDKYDSLANIEIVMFESQPSGCVDTPSAVCGTVDRTVEAGETVTVVCDPPVTGRYLRVNKKSEGALSMCEIVMRKQDD